MMSHFSLHSSFLVFFYRTKVNFGHSSSRYFTELQQVGSNLGLTGFNMEVWMFVKINFCISYSIF